MTRMPIQIHQPAEEPAFFGFQPSLQNAMAMMQEFEQPQQPLPQAPAQAASAPAMDPIQSALQTMQEFEAPSPAEQLSPAEQQLQQQEQMLQMQGGQQPLDQLMQMQTHDQPEPVDPTDAIDEAAEVMREFELEDHRRKRREKNRQKWMKDTQKRWYDNLDPEKKASLDKKIRIATDSEKIREFMEERKGDLWYRDPFGKSRQHDVVERVQRRLPFVGAAIEGLDFVLLKKSYDRYKDGKATDEDIERIGAFAVEMESQEQKKGIGERTLDIASQLPGFAVEFLATGGVFSGIRAGGKAALVKGLRKQAKEAGKRATARMLKRGVGKRAARIEGRKVRDHVINEGFNKAVGSRVARGGVEAGTAIAGVAGQTAANPQRIFQATARELLDQSIKEEDENFTKALGRGTLDSFIEMASERTGALVSRTKAARFLKEKILSKALKKGMDKSRLARVIKQGGYDGVFEEIFEERVADVARGVTGLDKFEIPERDQWIAEFLAFSIPGAAQGYGGYRSGMARRLRKTRKEHQKLVKAKSKEAQREWMMNELDGYAKGLAERHPELEQKIADLNGEAPTRKQWREMGFPAIRMEKEDRKKVVDAIMENFVVTDLTDADLLSDITDLGEGDLVPEESSGEVEPLSSGEIEGLSSGEIEGISSGSIDLSPGGEGSGDWPEGSEKEPVFIETGGTWKHYAYKKTKFWVKPMQDGTWKVDYYNFIGVSPEDAVAAMRQYLDGQLSSGELTPPSGETTPPPDGSSSGEITPPTGEESAETAAPAEPPGLPGEYAESFRWPEASRYAKGKKGIWVEAKGEVMGWVVEESEGVVRVEDPSGARWVSELDLERYAVPSDPNDPNVMTWGTFVETDQEEVDWERSQPPLGKPKFGKRPYDRPNMKGEYHPSKGTPSHLLPGPADVGFVGSVTVAKTPKGYTYGWTAGFRNKKGGIKPKAVPARVDGAMLEKELDAIELALNDIYEHLDQEQENAKTDAEKKRIQAAIDYVGELESADYADLAEYVVRGEEESISAAKKKKPGTPKKKTPAKKKKKAAPKKKAPAKKKKAPAKKKKAPAKKKGKKDVATSLKEAREKNQEDAVNLRYFAQARAKAGKLKLTKRDVSVDERGPKAKKPKMVTHKGEVFPNGDLALKQDGKDWDLVHVHTGLWIKSAKSKTKLKLLYQMMEDAGILDFGFKEKNGLPQHVIKNFPSVVKAWENDNLNQLPPGGEIFNKMKGTIQESQGPQADFVVDRATLGKGQKKTRWNSDLEKAVAYNTKDELIKRLKSLITEVPEFGYNPVFVVVERQMKHGTAMRLNYRDGHEFNLLPEQFMIDESELEEGMTVGINLEDLGLPTVTKVDATRKVLAKHGIRASKVPRGGDRMIRLTDTKGEKHTIGVTESGVDMTGDPKVDAILKKIRFVQPGQKGEGSGQTQKAESRDPGPDIGSFMWNITYKFEGGREDNDFLSARSLGEAVRQLRLIFRRNPIGDELEGAVLVPEDPNKEAGAFRWDAEKADFIELEAPEVDWRPNELTGEDYMMDEGPEERGVKNPYDITKQEYEDHGGDGKLTVENVDKNLPNYVEWWGDEESFLDSYGDDYQNRSARSFVREVEALVWSEKPGAELKFYKPVLKELDDGGAFLEFKEGKLQPPEVDWRPDDLTGEDYYMMDEGPAEPKAKGRGPTEAEMEEAEAELLATRPDFPEVSKRSPLKTGKTMKFLADLEADVAAPIGRDRDSRAQATMQQLEQTKHASKAKPREYWPQDQMKKEMAKPIGTDKPINEHEIVRAMEVLLNTRFNLNRMSRSKKSVRGWAETLNHYQRMRGKFSGGLGVEIHETAHIIDYRNELVEEIRKMTDPLGDTLSEELRDLDYDQKQRRRHEGFAEYIRHYVTEDHDPATQAPEFHKWFQKRHPETVKTLNRIRALVRRWKNQGAAARIRGQIRTGGYPEAAGLTPAETIQGYAISRLERHYMLFKDEAYYIGKMSNELRRRGHKGLTPYEYVAAHTMAAPAHAERSLFNGVYTQGPGVQRKLAEGLFTYKDHVEPGEYEDFRDYMVAVHALEVWEKGVAGFEANPGLNQKDAEELVSQVAANPSKKARFDKAHQIVTDYNNALNEMYADIPSSLSKADLGRMKRKWEKYVPLYRLMKDRNNFVSRMAAKGGLNVRAPVFRRKPGGSGLPIQDPIVSTIQRSVAFHTATLRQSVKWETIQAVVKRPGLGLDGVGGMGDSLEFDVDPKIARYKWPVEKALKELTDLGIVPEEHAALLRAAHYYRSGKYGVPTITILAGHLDLPIPAEPPAKNKKQEGDWPDNWEDFSRRHWNRLSDSEKDTIIDAIDDEIDNIPDIMEQITLFKPQFTAEHGDFIEVVYLDNLPGKNAGKPKPYLVRWDPEIYKSLDAMDHYQGNVVTKVFRVFNALKKTGAIGLNLAFSPSNFFRDMQALAHQSKFSKGMLDSTSGPFYWIFRYAHDLSRDFARMVMGKQPVVRDETIDLWNEWAGNLATRLGADRSSAMRYSARVNNLSKVEKAKHMVMSTKDFLRDWISITEVGPRLHEYHRALEAGGYSRKWDESQKKYRIVNKATGQYERPDRDTLVKAINAANDVTTNFKRRGRFGKAIDAYVTFFNAVLEGQDKQFRTILEAAGKGDFLPQANPADAKMLKKLQGRLFFATLTSAAATLAYWLMRYDDDDYIVAPEWLNNGFWTIPAPFDNPLPGGKFKKGDPIIRIPRDHNWNLVPLFVESMLNDFAGNERSRRRQVAEAIKHVIADRNPLGSPVDKGFIPFVLGTEVPIVKPSIESMANYDMFRQKEIEDIKMRQAKPVDRFNAYTTERAKFLGRRTGNSPAMIDHWLDSASGGMWRDLFRDPIRGISVKKDYADDVPDFWSEWKEIRQEIGSLKQRGEAVPEKLKQRKAMFDAYSTVMSDLREPVKDKRYRARFSHEKYMIGLARHALGRPPLKKYPNPFESTEPEIREIVKGHLEDWAWTATGPTDSQARRNARHKIEDLDIPRKRLVPLIKSHGLKEYREAKKKTPFKRVQAPAGFEARQRRMRRLQFVD